MLVLFETAAGLCLFKVVDESALNRLLEDPTQSVSSKVSEAFLFFVFFVFFFSRKS